ncbi:MAG: DUF72 domain-containing protein [Gammaproteobacteria bacterium]|nr:DUF72 domain-containing protein [Gammaproteobacteria bacterium]
MKDSDILIGTSGWSYDQWRCNFYPEDLAQKNRLEYYIKHFSTVEINSSFYHLPAKKTLHNWYETVPENFIFTTKASRYITHMKKLKDSKESLTTFFDHISVLSDKLGPILFQLPPRWHFNAERLSDFLNMLSADYRYAFEFRDHSWHNTEAYDLLSKNNAAFCIYELEGFLSPKIITTNFVYVRLHGPNDAYQGSYDAPTLSGWAGAFSTWSSQGREIYCYFDNDEAGYAAQNALQLNAMLHKKSGRD